MTGIDHKYSPFPISDELRLLKTAIQEAGGYPIVVGGSVRDHLLGLDPKDIDLEVFQIPLDKLEAGLKEFRVDAVGKSFGVLKVQVGKHTFDVALPRRETKAGVGHRGFDVRPDHEMTFAEAASRRDFTVNAIGWDFKFGYLDPFDGMKDLESKLLRHVKAESFVEDPLRVLRGCQFASRLGFKIVDETAALCKKLLPELKTLPVERFWNEFQKLLLRSPKPSIGLNALIETGAIEHFPELNALRGVPEWPEWHPEDYWIEPGHRLDDNQKIELFKKAAVILGERVPVGQNYDPKLTTVYVGSYLVGTGGVWTHNCCVVDGAAKVLREDEVEDDEEKLVVLLGALCHDLGKPITTKYVDGRWRAHKHSEAGEVPTRTFLARIGCPPSIVEKIIPIVLAHLQPAHFFRDQVGPSTIRRLALKVPLKTLLRVARADHLGSGLGKEHSDSRMIDFALWLMARAEEVKVADSAPKPILMGRHLLELGLKPGPALGKLCKEAFEAQIDGGFEDEVGAIAWVKTKL